MNKIRILLIDDNPQSLMPNTEGDSFYPLLTFGFNDPEFKTEVVPANFELGWLQSPRDVVEFRSFTDRLIQAYGPHCLMNKGFVPEIVLFDYKLSEEIGSFVENDSEEYKSLIPTYRLSRELDTTSYRFPDWTHFADRIASLKAEAEKHYPHLSSEDHLEIAKSKIKDDMLQGRREFEPAIFNDDKDDMGCYAGGLIALQFKDHPCVGIPITSKAGETDISPDALFFEWLLAEDFDQRFGKKYGKWPFWDEMLPEAVHLLRQRIKSLVSNGKVIPFYDQLIRFSNGQYEREQDVFSFASVFGERNLRLEGLFLSAEESVEQWSKELLEVLPGNKEHVGRARKISDTLWNTFVKDFDDRILLSDYANRKTPLNSGEQRAYNDIKRRLCDPSGTRIDPECSIQILAEAEDKSTIRLIVLLIATRAEIELEKCREFAPSREEYVDLSRYDFINMLFPKVNLKNQLILPMHAESKTQASRFIDQPVSWLSGRLTIEGSKVSDGNCFEFKEWITPGESGLLKSIFYDERQYYPQWLR